MCLCAADGSLGSVLVGHLLASSPSDRLLLTPLWDTRPDPTPGWALFFAAFPLEMTLTCTSGGGVWYLSRPPSFPGWGGPGPQVHARHTSPSASSALMQPPPSSCLRKTQAWGLKRL